MCAGHCRESSSSFQIPNILIFLFILWLIQINCTQVVLSHIYGTQFTEEKVKIMHTDDKQIGLNVGKTVLILFGLMFALIILANAIV